MIWQYSKSKPKKKSARRKKVDSDPPTSLMDSAKVIKGSPDETISTLRQRR